MSDFKLPSSSELPTIDAAALNALPIFPLPSTLLLPQTIISLHIFEPRYRQLVADCIQGAGMMGVPLLKPGYEKDYEGRPEIFPVFGFGAITQSERLDDGALFRSCCKV